MTEAASAVKRHAFGRHGLTTLVSYILPQNVRSQRVAARLGARVDGQTKIRETTVDVWRHPRE
jgi:RimJ/RimL family protein N-acetyltransferase